MIIGQPYADFILRHHPDKSRRLTQEEALSLLQEEHARGHLHSAWFKDAMGGRFYCICNCCKCCCGGVEAMLDYKTPIMISSGYVAAIDPAACRACGRCAAACPFEAIEAGAADGGEPGSTAYRVDEARCMGCEVCGGVCASGAISFRRDAAKPEPLDVRLLK